MSRGWSPIDGDPRWGAEGYYEEVQARADGLAKWWSTLTHTAEQAAFMRDDESRYDPGEDCPLPGWYQGRELDPDYIRDVADYEAQAAVFQVEKKAAEEEARAQIEYCEDKLRELGARMMRPYEHWNEEEGLIAYLERDR